MSERTSCEQLLFPDNDLCQGCFFLGCTCSTFPGWLLRWLWHPKETATLGCLLHGRYLGRFRTSQSLSCAGDHHPHSPQGICTLSLSATLLHKLLSPSTTLEGATGAIITVWCQIRQASYCGRAHSQSLWRPESTDYIRPDDWVRRRRW